MMREIRHVAVAAFATLALAGALAAGAQTSQPGTSAARLERLKKLTGDWVMVDADGNPTERVVATYRVTSGGSVLQETLFGGTDHEMVTMYHLDGPDLVLTHYCAVGNQPRMKATPGDSLERIEFEFAGGSNIDPAKDAHMHSAVIELRGEDRLHSEWSLHADGRKQDTKVFDLVRKRQE
jgi:hypothetical protein